MSEPVSGDVKTCCADLYASDWARLLLGESFHPGGLQLTEHVGGLLGLNPTSRVLDVAAGRGSSAIHLSRRFGCTVVGLEYSAANVMAARVAARSTGLEGLLSFEEGDAERLRFPDGAFDAVICECAFCTFPNKAAAASEMARVLRPGGAVGLADVVRRGALPEELEGLLAWIACIGDARPAAEYTEHLREAGLALELSEDQDEALAELVRQIRLRLLTAQVAARLGRLSLPGADFPAARRMARAAERAVADRILGYTLLVARRPDA